MNRVSLSNLVYPIMSYRQLTSYVCGKKCTGTDILLLFPINNAVSLLSHTLLLFALAFTTLHLFKVIFDAAFSILARPMTYCVAVYVCANVFVRYMRYETLNIFNVSCRLGFFSLQSIKCGC